ncbi:MAG: non-hydrolyzing UDP-N-acetylglucosamine 2-epimerase [Candidatus Woesearchaeota archaeon]
MKIAVVLGTRPEIIKMAPVIKQLEKNKVNYFIIHTNQHYSKDMDAVIFEDLNLKKAKYNLEVGSGIHGLQTGKMLERIEEVYLKEKPDIVLVHGDTNTTLAGALAAKKMNIKVGHVEAGIRSNDKTMPEEINRVLVDHMIDYYFAPTVAANKNLRKENIPEEKIFVVGNTIVDAVLENAKIAEKKSGILKRFNQDKNSYILVTAHRPENVDNKKKLKDILSILEKISEKEKVLFSLHPRTKKKIEEFNLKIPEKVTAFSPVGYLDFLMLEKNAKLILTDSGGLQEEACILNVPCITLRENTERPESVLAGANIIAGTKPEKVISSVYSMINAPRCWENPFGKGKTSIKITKILVKT